MGFLASTRTSVVLAFALPAVVVGCGADDGGQQNVLPGGESSTSAGSNGSADESGGEPVEPPAAYRFDCIDIQGVGDADGTSVTAGVLESTWSDDIANFKLNIVLEVRSRDAAAGTAQVGIRSAIGPSVDDMCSEPSSESDVIDIAYDEATTAWTRASGDGVCSEPAASGAASSGTYQLELGKDDVIYIYAQDVDGTTFNCSPDQAVPDAVPLSAIAAEVTADPDGRRISGQLTGCLTQARALALCSCLGSCTAEGPDDVQTEGTCAGCPKGGITLDELLGGVEPSTRCTDLMGEPSFDLTIGFTGSALPSVPQSC